SSRACSMSVTSALLLSGSHRSASSISLKKGDTRRPKVASHSEDVVIGVLLAVGRERAARVEVDGGGGALRRWAARRAPLLAVGDGVDDTEGNALAVELDDGLGAVEEAR